MIRTEMKYDKTFTLKIRTLVYTNNLPRKKYNSDTRWKLMFYIRVVVSGSSIDIERGDAARSVGPRSACLLRDDPARDVT